MDRWLRLTLLLLFLLALPGQGRSQSAGIEAPATGVSSRDTTLTVPSDPPRGQPAVLSYHGVRFDEAWSDLTRRLGVVSVFDASVSGDDRSRRIRVDARHVMPGEACRWLARLADLVAVEREGVWLVARAEAVPRTWRMAQPPPRTVENGLPGNTRVDTRAEIDWLDAPLSRVARDVADAYGVDALFAPDLQASQPMLTVKWQGVDLPTVITEMERQLSARAFCWDGALWIQPNQARLPAGAEFLLSREGEASVAGDAETGQERGTLGPAATIEIGPDQDSWQKLADHLTRPDVKVRLEIRPGHLWPAMEARGSAEEVLTASALLGRLSFEMLPREPSGVRTLVIRAGRE